MAADGGQLEVATIRTARAEVDAFGEVSRFGDLPKTGLRQLGRARHHLVEQRHLRFWGLSSESEEVPGVLLSESYHAEITSTLRNLMRYARTYSPSEVLGNYRLAYQDNPAMLEAVEEWFSRVLGVS